MQHLRADAQVAIKQRVLEDNLWHISKVRPVKLMQPIVGPDLGLPLSRGLSVRNVRKKMPCWSDSMRRNQAMSPRLKAAKSCRRTFLHVNAVKGLDRVPIVIDVPQIELAVGENVTAMVLRIMRH